MRKKLIELLTDIVGFIDWDNIANLADYLIENGVVIPPCKVGDTVYQTDGVRVYESTIKNVIYVTEGVSFDKNAIGKSIFLTREDAEKESEE